MQTYIKRETEQKLIKKNCRLYGKKNTNFFVPAHFRLQKKQFLKRA